MFFRSNCLFIDFQLSTLLQYNHKGDYNFAQPRTYQTKQMRQKRSVCMKKIIKNFNFLLILTVILGIQTYNLRCDNRIIVYLKNAPDPVIQDAIQAAKGESLPEKIEQLNAQTPGQVSQRLVKNGFRTLFTPQCSGFMAIYGGYMDVSNNDGLLSFPLRHTFPKVLILVAPEISLVKVKEGTVSHRELVINNEVQSELYLFERKQDEKKNFFWSVSKQELPADKKINPLTVVLLAKTKNVFISEGNFLSAESPHLVLPDIYVLSTMDQEKILMQALDIKRYFEPITQEEKKVNETTMQKMVTNI